MHKKLGPKAYSNIMNLNVLNEKLKLAAEEDTDFDLSKELKRRDMFNVLCPNCLRKTLVKTLS
jgi:hypothetical protein